MPIADLPPPDLLLSPLGVSCTDCGAVLPSGTAAPVHYCPEAADRRVAERVRTLLGGAPAGLAAGLYRAALAQAPAGERGDTVRGLMAALRATASELAALLGQGPHAGPPGWRASL